MTILQETTRGTSAKNAIPSCSGVGWLRMARIVGFQGDVADESVLVRYQVALLSNQLPTFRRNMVPPP
jgi:hypothetical protein